MREVGRGLPVFAAVPVRGRWRLLADPSDVIGLMDAGGAAGIVAGVHDAGATFLAPLFEDLTAVVCTSGTPLSHIGIVSREYQTPCVMAARFDELPPQGAAVEVDCSGPEGVVRVLA